MLPEGAAPAETAELKKRIAELELGRESEIAQARQVALQQGFRQGQEESAAEIKTSSERLAKTLADLAAWKKKLRAEAEMDLLNLALAIARRILRRELITDPEAMHGLVYAALQKIQKREIWRVRVYPAGVDAVRSCLDGIGAGSIEMVADSTLKPGDLLIETAVGELDASVDTQLQEIERGFADRLALR
jgi:flagellar assembly protein FliH